MREVQNLAENNPADVGQGITIISDFEMGDGFDSYTPLLTAQIRRDKGSHIDTSGFRVIIDGIVYDPDYDDETGTLSLQVPEPLLEKFHVVTCFLQAKIPHFCRTFSPGTGGGFLC